MEWEELMLELNNNHFYPAAVIKNKKVQGLEINAPALTGEQRLERVREVLPTGFIAEFFPNEEIISIKKK
jgi:hypothetical protein